MALFFYSILNNNFSITTDNTMNLKNTGFFIVFTILFNVCSFAQNEAGYELKAAEPHYFLITMTNRNLDIHDVRTEVTKYVWTYHAADKLQLSHILIGENRSVGAMFLQEFKNEAHAMRFYEKLQEDQPDFMQMGLTKHYLVISKSNYEQMLRNQSLKGYETFFEDNYLK